MFDFLQMREDLLRRFSKYLSDIFLAWNSFSRVIRFDLTILKESRDRTARVITGPKNEHDQSERALNELGWKPYRWKK